VTSGNVLWLRTEGQPGRNNHAGPVKQNWCYGSYVFAF
jgi:hypothetical protein